MFCICPQHHSVGILPWAHVNCKRIPLTHKLHMNLTLHEVNHILRALNGMSNHDVARAREMIAPGVTDHDALVQKLKDYKLRLQ